ncbi:FtsK/SpoIIIE domain-containing protein [Catenulispora rubra]|uniref:FtsK/SpoIIIE domain-containing protein n=1 Tax=Catenulispora rubra TaxID=280293 RepID=UPI0018922FFD|nr:FtsK/SpoIIIE domain-containing protein [Catenulispora rubra]
MRMTLTVVDPVQGSWMDALLDADGESSIPQVADQLGRMLGAQGPNPGSPPLLFVDGNLVDQRHTLASSPLREGSVVSLHNPSGCLPAEPYGTVEVRVAGGPDAGGVHRINPGYADIGRSRRNRVKIDDPGIPDFALRVSLDVHGVIRLAPYEGVAAVLEKQPLVGEAEWKPGMQVVIGTTILEVGYYTPPDAALTPSEDGAFLDYNRPPRILPPERQTRFKLPQPVVEESKRPFPVVMLIAPLLMSVVMAVVMGQPRYLIMAAMSPMMMLGNFWQDKKSGKSTFVQKVAEYEAKKARIEQDARDALALERNARRQESPDPATLLDIGIGPRQRLWERRRRDADHLLLRVGTLDQDSEVVLEDPEQDEHRRNVAWTVPEAPVTIPLKERGVIGVAGPAGTPRALARWLVAQTAALSSPDDVQFVLLTDSHARQDWEWMRWLPHLRPTAGQNATALIGTDAESVAQRIAEVSQQLSFRMKEQMTKASSPTEQVMFKDPDIVVILDGSRRLRSMPGVIQILQQGPTVGIRAICLDGEDRFLPGECQAIVVVEPEGLRVQQVGKDMQRGVRPDAVSPVWCQRLVRGLAAVRDVSGNEEASGIPNSARLLDVLGLEPPTSQAIAARWTMGGETTMAMLGESFDGAFGIDIRRDGPHGLIAGTTGAGKSELLQTIVASLAVANKPTAMTFVLVDYKGGSAFKDCVQLPHTVGMVTDLDNHLVERALESLGAELKRREHILAEAGAKDIEDYGDIRRKNTHLAPMPRLLIVIDEFASMVRELPDFVTGLVNIAQRGRSLGIHLLLATQRPSGVVSPEIRANTNLRIALRVTDGNESSDVIDDPSAGFISKSTPGRAYVRLGANSLVPFQAGRVGGRRPGANVVSQASVWSTRLDWPALASVPPKKPEGPKVETDAEITDLKVLVDAIREATAAMQIPPQHSPWLPALQDTVLLSDVPPVRRHGGHDLAPIPWGIDDLPSLQARRAAVLDFASLGHMLIAGAPRSGRSQVLRTMAGAIALTQSTADVHIYGIDCGSGALLPLTALPHCGAVVQRQQSERATRLITRLKQEIANRQESLSAQGFAGIIEQRMSVPADQKLPHIVVFLDRWDGFLGSLGELDGGVLVEEVQRIMREGQGVGVHMVITGDRQVFSGRIASLTEDKLSFRLPDKQDFGLINLHPRKIPDEIVAGRAFRSDSGLETQVALLTADGSGQAQAAAIAAIAEQARGRDAQVPRARRPFRVDVLPTRISLAEAWELRDESSQGRPLWALAGVGGDELIGAGPDLGDGVPGFIIAGPQKSGRSTMLMAMARTLVVQGSQVVLVAPRNSPLRKMAGERGVLAVFENADLSEEDLRSALDSAGGHPVAVLIDDAEMLKEAPAGSVLRDILNQGGDRGQALVLAGSAEDLNSGFSGWHVDARRGRRGALMSPQSPMDGDLIGVRLNRSQVGGQVQAGRALLHLGDGEMRTVQVPID